MGLRGSIKFDSCKAVKYGLAFERGHFTHSTGLSKHNFGA